MIFLQMITLFVTPVIYLWLEWFREHVLGKVPHMRHEGESRPQPAAAGDGQIQPAPAAAR